MDTRKLTVGFESYDSGMPVGKRKSPINTHRVAWQDGLRAASFPPPAAPSLSHLSTHLANASRQGAELVKQAVLETAWPTRCAICDEQGMLLCSDCRRNLPYIDWWSACPKCGAPGGLIQCTECNETVLARAERSSYPFESCIQVTTLNEHARQVVLTYKDGGEQRLAQTMAALMAYVLPPSWKRTIDAVSFIPSSKQALQKRGFDHMHQLSWWFARYTELPHQSLFARPKKKDQRELTRKERFQNMTGSFQLLNPCSPLPAHVLLIDDVFTTGATLSAATDVLLEAGAESVRCLTFARAW